MFLHVFVRNNIVVLKSVLAWAEVPWLLLGVVVTTLQSLQFVIKVDHVVGLFVSQSSITVTCKHIDHVLLLGLLNNRLGLVVIVNLGDGVIKEILRLNELGRNLVVGVGLSLEITLVVNVLTNVFLPLGVALWQTVLLRKLANICN